MSVAFKGDVGLFDAWEFSHNLYCVSVDDGVNQRLSIFLHVKLRPYCTHWSSFEGGFDIAELSDHWFPVGTHAERVAVDEWTHFSHGATIRKFSLSDEILWKP